MRKLLYHRDLDDSIGTYWTDYVVGIIIIPMCVYLTVKICKTKKKNFSLRWNSNEDPEATLMSCAVVVYSLSMAIMAVLGGVAHQTLQLAENYETWTDDMKYLIIWKLGTAMFSPTILALMCMSDMIIAQETNIKVPIMVRKIFYICSIILSVAVLAYNFAHMFMSKDPFSLKNLFYVFFLAIAINGISMILVIIYRLCQSSSITESTPNSTECGIPEPVKPKSVFKMAASRCNRMCVGSKKPKFKQRVTIDLFMYFLAPWIFVVGGATNFVLRPKCSDSHDAFHEKGCPLSNNFNHNALFHVIFTIALAVVIVSELLAIKRRSNKNNHPCPSHREDEVASANLVPHVV